MAMTFKQAREKLNKIACGKKLRSIIYEINETEFGASV